jgi:hypothetical protein
VRYLRGFGAFWYDFLVGDRWELFLGPIAALLVAWLALSTGLPAAITGLVLFCLIVGVGGLSVAWALRR